MSIYFAGNTRLPMVAGWDSLLPNWFTRLHPKYKTPVNSILFVGAVTLVLGLLSLTGVGAQEAFQLLDNAGGVFYAMTYLVLFAIPMFGMKAFGVRCADLVEDCLCVRFPGYSDIHRRSRSFQSLKSKAPLVSPSKSFRW